MCEVLGKDEDFCSSSLICGNTRGRDVPAINQNGRGILYHTVFSGAFSHEG